MPAGDPRLFDLGQAAASTDYCQEVAGVAATNGVQITELSTHLQGQLVAVHPAYDEIFDGFAAAAVRGDPGRRRDWAAEQVKLALTASRNFGLTAQATFSGALAWPYLYPWPQRPPGLIEAAFDELAARWRPILDHAGEMGVDLCFEIHPGEDLHDGVTFEMFLDRVGGHPRAKMLYDPSHYVLQALDYLENIDIYHDRIGMFHVKDAELNPIGRQGVYGGYQAWVDRAGRFRSPGDGQVDFGAVFAKLTQYGYGSWAVVEWECALKHPEDGAREGAAFVRDHVIRVTERAFDDFAAGGTDERTAGCWGWSNESVRNRARWDTTRRALRCSGGITPLSPIQKHLHRWNASVSRFAGCAGPIKLGMVGGGQGAFIGAVHRIAARLDGAFELVAGALSSDPERARASAAEIGLAPDRAYDDFAAMARHEARLGDGIEAVAIVTPNHMHLPVAREFLRRGVHVICDKPLTATLAEARRMVQAAERSQAVFVLTHNYSGYPLVRQAREMVAAGALGDIRVVQVEYAQDWLAEAPGDNQQAAWRTDPARAGPGGACGDIGTHAFQLARFVTGLRLDALAADLQAFVEGRQVDDNGHVLLRFEGGARGVLWFSQVAAGEENRFRLRVYGTKAGLEWAQENPNELWFAPLGEPRRRLTRGGPATGATAARVTRIPAGHPEGFLEAFANIYAEAARAIRAHREGRSPPGDVLFPTVHDGLEGVAFVDACVRSSQRDAAWVTLR